MSALLTQALLRAESAVPTKFAEDGTPLGSPGFLGFVMTLILGVFIIFLMLDMSRRARRMRYRNEYALAREAQEEAARQKGSSQDPSASTAGRQQAPSPTADGVPSPPSAEAGLAEHIRRAH
ncbi:MAG: hypothetical protein Q4C74_01805 [Rothia sp. (in: high G+C Gram-positive bacteria)]|nr:hypothetical protein [Rothia sp. (in: high G+C Gram-positive bacteria)]